MLIFTTNQHASNASNWHTHEILCSHGCKFPGHVSNLFLRSNLWSAKQRDSGASRTTTMAQVSVFCGSDVPNIGRVLRYILDHIDLAMQCEAEGFRGITYDYDGPSVIFLWE
jgi:hypothetical protein